MKNIKEGDIIVEVVQNAAMTRIEVYRINSIMSGEIEYGEEARDSWAINAEYKDFVKGLTSWHREFNNCLIDCRKFEKDEQGPDFIRELRSKWYFEKDRPVYVLCGQGEQEASARTHPQAGRRRERTGILQDASRRRSHRPRTEPRRR